MEGRFAWVEGEPFIRLTSRTTRKVPPGFRSYIHWPCKVKRKIRRGGLSSDGLKFTDDSNNFQPTCVKNWTQRCGFFISSDVDILLFLSFTDLGVVEGVSL